MTPAQKERTQRMMAEYAKEDVTIEEIKGTLYVFGSELACRRIYHKYRYSKGIDVAYSTNLETWFFELPMGQGGQPEINVSTLVDALVNIRTLIETDHDDNTVDYLLACTSATRNIANNALESVGHVRQESI